MHCSAAVEAATEFFFRNMRTALSGFADGFGRPAMTDRVNLREELEAVGIDGILEQLDRELIGLKPVKTRIREIASLLLIERIRKRMNLSSGVPTLHMSFTGNPGTGKTTLALRIASILHKLGFVPVSYTHLRAHET